MRTGTDRQKMALDVLVYAGTWVSVGLVHTMWTEQKKTHLFAHLLNLP